MYGVPDEMVRLAISLQSCLDAVDLSRQANQQSSSTDLSQHS